jgi:hypothetical protein
MKLNVKNLFKVGRSCNLLHFVRSMKWLQKFGLLNEENRNINFITFFDKQGSCTSLNDCWSIL